MDRQMRAKSGGWRTKRQTPSSSLASVYFCVHYPLRNPIFLRAASIPVAMAFNCSDDNESSGNGPRLPSELATK